MKITKLYTDNDNQSHFEEIDMGIESEYPLGHYSKFYPTKDIQFREFKKGLFYNWHNAPQPQYIIYLEGLIEIEISNGEKRIFQPGDVLFVTDLTGEGHITRTLTNGRSIIVRQNT